VSERSDGPSVRWLLHVTSRMSAPAMHAGVVITTAINCARQLMTRQMSRGTWCGFTAAKR